MFERNALMTVLACTTLLAMACSKNEASRNGEVPHAAAGDPTTEEPPTYGPTSQTRTSGGEMQASPQANNEGVKPEPVATPALSDAQIAKVTDTVNSGEIAQAQIAARKAVRADVKQFAAFMISEHTKAKQKDKQLAEKLGIQPEDTQLATDLDQNGSDVKSMLETTDTSSFDRTYIDAQVEAHHKVLTLLNERLIPNATNPQLKMQLEDARAMVEKHLSKATALQQSLR